MNDQKKIITQVPKVELHVHLEGALPTQLVLELAKENDLPDPTPLFGPNNTVAWKDFTDFLGAYDKISFYIQSARDLQKVTYTYLKQCHEEGAVYVELTVSPQHTEQVGLNYEQTMEAVAAGIDQARQEFGIEARMLIVLVRHTGVETCAKVLDRVIANQHPYIVGIGLAGDERSFPAIQFKQLFEKAHDTGLQCTAHAGEWGGAAQVKEAIKELGIKRIGHGVQVIEDPALLEEVIDQQIHLEVCPMSNIALRVFPDYDSHPIHHFQKNGVNFSLNSDDPPFFGTTLGYEYHMAAEQLKLQPAELLKISQNALAASFAPESLKQSVAKTMQAQFDLIAQA